ncbi:MAG TPA: hypothetical protein PLM00_00795, partial [Spirochaetota bacterium]|nr:hypothetical protein [Spirochaetota bacterium]
SRAGFPRARVNIVTIGQLAVGQTGFESCYTSAFNRYVRLGDIIVVSTTAANYRQFSTKIQAADFQSWIRECRTRLSWSDSIPTITLGFSSGSWLVSRK